MSFSLKTWIKVAVAFPPSVRAMRYEAWRKENIMPVEWINEIEKRFPPIPIQKPSEPNTGSIGLGDIVKSITDALHIPQCGGCKKRQEKWNKVKIPLPLTKT